MSVGLRQREGAAVAAESDAQPGRHRRAVVLGDDLDDLERLDRHRRVDPFEIGGDPFVAGKAAAPRHRVAGALRAPLDIRSEEHTSELQSLMRTSYAVFCLE